MAKRSHRALVREQIELCSKANGTRILNEMAKKEKLVSSKQRKMENRCKLEAMIEAFESVFIQEDIEFVQEVRDEVFEKWRTFNYLRNATLAPQDIIRVVNTYPYEVQKRFQELRPSFEEQYKKLAFRALVKLMFEEKKANL